MKHIKKILAKTSIVIIMFIMFMSIFLLIGYAARAQCSIKFNGSNYVDFGHVEYELSYNMTIMTWVKWCDEPSEGNNWANLVTINSINRTDRGQFWIQHNQNNDYFEFALATTNNANSNNFRRDHMFSTTSPEKGVWYHIAATYDGSDMRIYVNGLLENERNKIGHIYHKQDDFVLTFGAWGFENSRRNFSGQIRDVSIWNITLDNDEILYYMDHGVDDSNGLIGKWLLGNDTEDETGFVDAGVVYNNNGDVEMGEFHCIEDPLPITLYSFSIDKNKLTWTTSSEINNDYFTIERSTNMLNWEIIGTVEGSGFSNTKITYDFIDNNQLPGHNYYRLKQTDYDGSYEYFDAISVYVDSDMNINVYPNPSDGIVYIKNWNNNIKIVDISGVVMDTQEVMNLNNGIYVIYNGDEFIDKLIVR